jgi:hypothetical protein
MGNMLAAVKTFLTAVEIIAEEGREPQEQGEGE